MTRFFFLSFLIFALVVSAAWESGDSQNLHDIDRNVSDIWVNFNKMSNGNSGGDETRFLGWKKYQNQVFKILSESWEGESLKFKKVDGYETNELMSDDYWSSRNQTMFEHNSYIKDNSTYYANKILGNMVGGGVSGNGQITWNNETPEQMFMDYAHYGAMFSPLKNNLEASGISINSIKNSTYTQNLRNEFANVETKFNGMISDDYTQSYLNWDLSGIGDYFVRAGIMLENPFINLKGRFNIKPEVTDWHYEIWNRYFNRDYSQWAIALKYCLSTIMYLLFSVYVFNDLASIVGA